MAKAEDGKEYRWGYPSDWLREKLDTLAADGNVAELKSVADVLIQHSTEDDIQDIYQEEMGDDGYFKPLKKKSAGRTEEGA